VTILITTHISIHVSTYPFTCLHTYPIYLFTYPPTHIPTYLSIHLSNTHLSPTCLPIHLYTPSHPPNWFSARLSIFYAHVYMSMSISLHYVFLSDVIYLKHLLHPSIYLSSCSLCLVFLYLAAPPSVHKPFQPTTLSLSSVTRPESATSPLNQFSSTCLTSDLCHAIQPSSFEAPFFCFHPHKPQDHPLFPVSACLFRVTQITSRCRLHQIHSQNTTSLVCYKTVRKQLRSSASSTANFNRYQTLSLTVLHGWIKRRWKIVNYWPLFSS
jgi:hypothetical protein